MAQAFCQELWNVTDGGESLKRDLKLYDKSFFYPSYLSSSGLGFDHSVDSYVGVRRGTWSVAWRFDVGFFAKLMSNKNNSLSLAYAACRKTVRETGSMRDSVDFRRYGRYGGRMA